MDEQLEHSICAEEASRRLTPAELRRVIDPSTLGIRTTADCAPLEGVIGQPRAVSALKFGLSMRDAGFNIYVSGPNGIGKMSAIKSFLETEAQQRPAPPDWCYVNNFDDSYQPFAIRLPTGQARVFQQEIKSLVERVATSCPRRWNQRSSLTSATRSSKTWRSVEPTHSAR